MNKEQSNQQLSDNDNNETSHEEEQQELQEEQQELQEEQQELQQDLQEEFLEEPKINYQEIDYKQFDQIEALCNGNSDLLKGIFTYGFERPSPIQAKAIQPMADGRDLIAQSQSGTGKTGAFSIGMLLRINPLLKYPQGLIIANTRELASQIHYVLTNIANFMNIKVALCIGGIDVKSNLNTALNSHILIGTPGRIVDLISRQSYKHKLFEKLEIVVLDEADVLLKDDFLDKIKKILLATPKETQICIFSATFSEDALDLTKRFLVNPVHILVEKEKVSLNLIKHYKINVEEERNKYDVLTELYQNINICQAVIFVNSIDKADMVSDKMIHDGHSVGVIHSKLPDIERSKILTEFRNMHTRVLIATDIISRGIDVQQVGLVINYDIPSEPDKYIHRVGRSGRYNKTGVAINFVTKSRFDRDNISHIEDKYTIEINDLPSLETVSNYLVGGR
jgi:translation initiation factor 4A